MSTIRHLPINDRYGIRKNVTELLEQLDAGNLDSVVILFHTKDSGINRTYWNGRDEMNVFMAQLLIHSIVEGQELVEEFPTDPLNEKE